MKPSLRTLREVSGRRLSPTLFALIILAFTLPFATVSCGGKTTFTGVELATWTVPEGGPVGESECDADIAECVERRGSVLADTALAAAVCGLLLGLRRVRRGEGWCATFGLVAALLIGAQALQPLGPEVTFHSGYWLILGLFFWLAALHATKKVRRRETPKRELGPPLPNGQQPAGRFASVGCCDSDVQGSPRGESKAHPVVRRDGDS